MSATLIAVLLALFLRHAVAPLTRLRRYEWFSGWLGILRRHIAPVAASPWGILVSLGLPLLLVGWLQSVLSSPLHGVPGMLFAVAVLVYCWGPRDLDVDVEAIDEAVDADARGRAIARLAGPGKPIASDDDAGLVVAVFHGARRRWFGVLLWFVLIGPFGALLYRLAERGTHEEAVQSLSGDHAAMYRHLLAILDWPVAQLMSLALAIAGNFDAVYGAWRDWHVARKGQPFDFSSGFLDAVALAGTRQSLRDEVDERHADAEAGLDVPADVPATLPAMNTAMGLVWRILIVWLAVIALMVLAGHV